MKRTILNSLVLGFAGTLPLAAEAANLFDMLFNNNPRPRVVYQQPQPQAQPAPAPRTTTTSSSNSNASVQNMNWDTIRGDKPWVITKTAWSPADEAKFSQFVESLYDSGCNSVPNCMKGSGNWYRDKDPAGMTWYADCGRFPYLLRAYFAFHNGLPFQGATVATKRDPNDPNAALQYTAKGNYISKRKAVQSGAPGYTFIRNAVQSVYSAVYRVDSRLDVSSGQYSDFYHVAINRKNIRPGTVVYDPNGHIATVAKVTENGKVMLLDSHPDNSVTRITYTSAFSGSSAAQAGGFKNWRPVRIVNGQTVAASNAEAPGFSMEQFFGDQPNQGGFATAKWSTSDGILPSSRYVEVVRARMSLGAVKYEPVKEIIAEMNNICVMMKDRIESVNAAIAKGIQTKSIADGRLPSNIYGTSGEWEDYSTPSRDARLKTAMAEFYSDVQRIYTLYKARDPKVIYSGNDIVGDMLAAYDRASSQCQMSYRKSDGRVQALDFHSFTERVYKMSFDPYHCVELRMGATSSSELSSCNQSSTKTAWYEAQQSIRNSLNRPYEKKMGWSLAELQAGAALSAGVGVKNQTPLNVREFLRSVR